MPRAEPVGPYLALALAVVVTGALLLLWPGRSTHREARPGDWFGHASGGGVHLDQPVR